MYRQADAAELHQDILAEIAEARMSGQVLLTGDFNARTAHLSDQFEDDLSDHVALPSDHEFDMSQYAALLRQSCDAVVNDFGLLLLQLCQGARLSILNGRVQGDIPAHLPCHANAGGSVVDYFIASAGICSTACSRQVQDMTPDSDHYPVVLSLDMPMVAVTSCTPSLQAPRLKYESSRIQFFQTQLADNAGFLTDLGSHLFDVEGLSAEEGIQLLQDCIMMAAQQSYDTAKSSSAQPHHKPWLDSECRAALRSYKEAKQDPSSHEAKAFLKRFRTVVRRKNRHYTQHVAAKLTDLAMESPARFWKHFRQKGRTLPVADLDKWMRHFEKLLNVPMQDNSADAHLFDVHLPDLPSAAALNTTISPDEVSAAIKALKRNKASDLYGMHSEFIIDAASMLVTPISIVFNTVFDTDFPATHSVGRLFSNQVISKIWTITVVSQ